MLLQGHGKNNSKIMFVLDYPTKDELRTNIAGTGSCGRLIDLALSNHNSGLRDCYITSFGKEYIPMEGKKNRIPFKKMERYAREFYKENFEEYEKLLIEEINAINPNVLVPVGELALNVLTSEKNIEKFRGSILNICPNLLSKIEKKKFMVIPLEHPRTIFEEYLKYAVLQYDIQRIFQLQNVTDFTVDDSILWVCKSAGELENYFSRIFSGNPDFVATDIETYLGYPTCISFCHDGKEAVSIPLLDSSVPVLDLVLRWQSIAKFLDSRFQFIGHNFKYDLFFLERFGLPIKNIHFCTMLAGHTIYPELPKGLDFYTSIYTNVSYYKDEGKEFDPRKHDANRLYLYNAKDSLVDWLIAKKELEEMQENKTYHFFFNGPAKWFHAYRQIEANGILLDNSQRQILLTYYSSELERTIEELQKIAGKDFNPGSSEQVANLMYGQMGIPVQHHPKTKEITTEEDTIEYIILNVVENPEVKCVLNKILYCRKLKGIKKFLTMIVHPDGRARTIYSLMPESGRSSTPKRRAAMDWYYYQEGNKIKRQPYGWAFQIIPKRGFRLPDGTEFGKELTSIFIPTPGYAFVEGDLSQAEAREVAVLAEDWELLEDFDRGPGYVHKKTASWIFVCPIEQIIKGTHQYDIGKRGRHMTNYGASPPKLARIATIPIYLAMKVMNTINEKSPKIRGTYQHKVREQLRRYGNIITPFGRRRDFFGHPGSEETFREGFAHDPQSMTSDQTKFAMLRILEKCPWTRILIEGHDSLFAEVPIEHKEEFLVVQKKEMEKPIDFREGTFYVNYQLSIPVEQQWSDTNWMEMRSI